MRCGYCDCLIPGVDQLYDFHYCSTECRIANEKDQRHPLTAPEKMVKAHDIYIADMRQAIRDKYGRD